jgi:hypothetical protein
MSAVIGWCTSLMEALAIVAPPVGSINSESVSHLGAIHGPFLSRRRAEPVPWLVSRRSAGKSAVGWLTDIEMTIGAALTLAAWRAPLFCGGFSAATVDLGSFAAEW